MQTDDQTPATKRDLAELRKATKEDLARLEEKMATKTDIAELKMNFARLHGTMQEEFERLHGQNNQTFRDIQIILGMLTTIDKQTKPIVHDYERRISRIEKHVGLAA